MPCFLTVGKYHQHLVSGVIFTLLTCKDGCKLKGLFGRLGNMGVQGNIFKKTKDKDGMFTRAITE